MRIALLILFFYTLGFDAVLSSNKTNNKDSLSIKLENEYENIGLICNNDNKDIPIVSINFDNENLLNSDKNLTIKIDSTKFSIPKHTKNSSSLVEDRIKWNDFILALLNAKKIEFIKPSNNQLVIFDVNRSKKFDENETKRLCLLSDSSFINPKNEKNIWNFSKDGALNTFYINNLEKELILECGAINKIEIASRYKTNKISSNLYVSINNKKRIKIPTIKALKDFDMESLDYDKSLEIYQRQMKNWNFLTKQISNAKNLKFYHNKELILELNPTNQDLVKKIIADSCQ